MSEGGRHRRGRHSPADDLLPDRYAPSEPDQPGEDPGAEGSWDDDGTWEDEEPWEDEADPSGDGEPVRPDHRRRGERQGRTRRRHPVLVTLLAIVVVIVVVAAVIGFWASRQINPSGRPGHLVDVTIRQGESSGQIGATLVAAHVIHGDATLFRYYLRVNSSAPLLPGTYHLATNESYQSAISALQAGPVSVYDKLVIPEGFTLRDIAERIAALPGLHITVASVLAVSSQGSVRSAFEPAGHNDLEGLLFPATYPILQAPTTTAATILSTLVATFDERASELGLAQAATRRHMTPYQLITLASIVQGEAKLDGDRPKVASVLYNRLAAGMTLGADSTLIYALRLRHPNLDLNTVDYNQPNPYNTRIHTGLPPTPIDNPGIPSLQAAISPASTDDLYFVEVHADGGLGFASTNAGFDQLLQECQAAHLGCGSG